MKDIRTILKSRKGYNIWSLIGVGVAFVTITLVIAFGAQILGQIRSGQILNSYEYNITTSGLSSLDTFGDYMPTLAIVVVASVIIGILITYLVVRLFTRTGSVGA